MVQIIWSEQAIEELNSIYEFISQDSIRYAEITINRIMSIADRLEIFPLSGRIVPEINDETIREQIYGNYRVMYKVKTNEIKILTVHHSARFFDSESII